MNNVFVGTTKNNCKVYMDLHSSHAARHIEETPSLIKYTQEALLKLSPRGNNVFVQVDLGRVIGTSDLIATDENDTIVYAKRLGRDNYARFVLNKQPIRTTYLTVVLHKLEDDYMLYSAWIGPLSPPFPGDVHEAQESRSFWRHHALAWGRQRIQTGTEIDVWPWD
jgi:hypothetical protein